MSRRAAAPGGRRPGRPRKVDSEGTRQVVLDAAIDEFARLGFAGAGTRGIAEAAGVTPSTVYHHFGSKRALFLGAFAHSLDVAWSRYADAAASEGSLRDEIEAVLAVADDLIAERPSLTTLALRAQTELTQDEMRAMRGRVAISGLAEAMARRAVERGETTAADAGLVGPLVRMLLWGVSVVGRFDAGERAACLLAVQRVLDADLITPPGRQST